MKMVFFKIFWYAFPVSKLVYAYMAYLLIDKANNAFDSSSLIFIIIGIVNCLLGVYLSKKIYKKSFYDNKIVKLFLAHRADNNKPINLSVKFKLFIVVLGLAETAALFGLVQFILVGNLVVSCVLFALCFITWFLNYPNSQEIQEI